MTELGPRPEPASPAVHAAAARAFLAEELEPNTKRAYLGDVNAWVRYCTERGLPEWPIDADTIVNYIEHLVATGKALKTIQRRIGGLRSALKAAGRPLETHMAEAASRALVVARKKIMKEGTQEPDKESPQEPAGAAGAKRPPSPWRRCGASARPARPTCSACATAPCSCWALPSAPGAANYRPSTSATSPRSSAAWRSTCAGARPAPSAFPRCPTASTCPPARCGPGGPGWPPPAWPTGRRFGTSTATAACATG